MTDFDWIHYVSNGWKDGKSMEIEEYVPFFLQFVCVCHLKPNQSAERLARPPNKELLAILVSGLTLIQVDWSESNGGCFKHLAWPYLLHQHTSTLTEGEVLLKMSNYTMISDPLASICVSPSWKPDSWSEAPANVKKGNRTSEANQFTRRFALEPVQST